MNSPNRSPAELHFVSGKGGVGKSSVAAALASNLAARNEGPVLLIDVQGSGRSLRLLGLNRQPFENSALPRTRNAWGARILPRDTFKQYFSLLLSLGDDRSTFSQITSSFRDRLVELVFENKVVTAFVDVCPGLEPAVLLGKLHWEATMGATPEEEVPWRHIVVDAPATGHGVMLFRSAFALTEVFGGGAIFKQAQRMREFVLNPSLCKIYLVTTPEELPIQESLEMKSQLEKLGLRVRRFIVNRCPPAEAIGQGDPANVAAPAWRREVELQWEIWDEQRNLMNELRDKLKTDELACVPELPQGLDVESLPQAALALKGVV